ncbi:tyrosine-type recombinase/integrase [Thermodesulfobacteriota bacterium]
MTILAECPLCHNKQTLRNKLCICGENLDKAKRSRRVKYWIHYRLPGGKQRKELVGNSIEEARAAEGKRKSQKKENRIFDILQEYTITFNELSDWYLDLESIRQLATYKRVINCVDNFIEEYGDKVVGDIKRTDIEEYQTKREEQGKAPATIDMEISIIKTMVTRAFDSNLIDGRALKALRRVKRKLKKGRNARKRIISIEEYLKLVDHALPHLRLVIITAFNTGMRKGELRKLRWKFIDEEKMFIRLPPRITKESNYKNIPINKNVEEVLKSVPRYENHDFVFTYHGDPITRRDGLKKSFITACKNAGIPYGRKVLNGITFHDIRRTVKTYMLKAGVDKVYRDLILGHSLTGMDVHYLSPTDNDLKRAIEKYTDWLDKI